MDVWHTYLPLLIPLVLIQLALQAAAWIDIARRPSAPRGGRLVWVLIVFLGVVGPILYFVFGRTDESGGEGGPGSGGDDADRGEGR